MASGSNIRRSLVLAALGGVLLGTPRPAAAGDMAAAEVLFREGRRLLDSGQLAAACAKFAESQRLDPSSGTLLNLADCHEREGKVATAWAEFLSASRLARTQAEDARAAEAKRRADELEPRLSYLSVTVAEPSSGMVIYRDDIELDAAALASRLPVDPGEHVIRATAPGCQEWSRPLSVGMEPGHQTVTIPPLEKEAPPAPEPPAAPPAAAPPRPAPPAPEPPPAEADEPASTGTMAGYVVGGAGLVLTGLGVWAGLSARSTYASAEDMCRTHRDCSPGAMEERDAAEFEANLSNAAVGLGLIGVATGVLLLFTEPREGAPPSQQSSSALRFYPQVAADGVGAALGGRF